MAATGLAAVVPPGTAQASTAVVVPGTAGPSGPGGTYGEWGGSGIVATGVTAPGSVLVTAGGVVDGSTNPTFAQDVPAEGNGEVCGSTCLAPGLAAWSLVVKIGDGAWQQATTGTFTLAGTGPVYLAVNDGWYGDNRDAFEVTLDVSSAVTDALDAVAADSTGQGSGSSLSQKIEQAAASYEDGNVAAACGKVNAFGNEVRAQSGKGIDEATAQDLLDRAALIASAMGC